MESILIVTACFVPMWLLERLRPGRRWPSRPWWIARALAFNAAQVGIVFVAVLTWDRYLPQLALWRIDHLGVVPGALLGYVVITFIYYWWHRVRHSSAFLWRSLHQIHHSPQRLELLTAFYKHPAEILVNGVLSSSILYVLVGATAEQAGLAVLLTGIAELFYHWNVRTPYWLGFIIQRPESHCIHHERGRHTGNFSDLPLWDMLFGTFHNPREEQFKCGFGGDRELQLGRMLMWRAPGKGVRRDTH
jgi:sterol desaturase/sphingolipid hydroxylase (fatty acid hydroxylase superfamily)